MPTAERRAKEAAKKATKAGEKKSTLREVKKGDKDDTLTNEDKVGGATQTRLPGQERKTNKRLEKCALELNDLQTKRMSVQKKEQDKREELATIMDELKIEEYDLPGDLVAELDVKRKAKVHAKKDD